MSQRNSIVFDTDCILCSRWVHFIVAHEREAKFTFVNAWSDHGRELAAQHGLSENDLTNTYLVIEDGKGFIKSDATLAIVRNLKFPYNLLVATKVIPKILRDAIYAAVAKNRYQWFGYSKGCFVPSAEMKSRFIDR